MKNRAKMISLLMAVCMLLTLLPAVAFAARDILENVQATVKETYENGWIKKVEVTYDVAIGLAGADMKYGIQTFKFRESFEDALTYGDFTNFGYYANNNGSYNDWSAAPTTNGYSDGIGFCAWATAESSTGLMNSDGSVYRPYGGNTQTDTIVFGENASFTKTSGTYYVYGWAKYGGRVYPDELVCVFNVNEDGTFVQVAEDSAAKTYRISFNRNTQDAAATGTMEDQIFTEGVPQAIKANAFSVPGYVFTGWNTQQNRGGTSYDDEEVITLNEDIMNGSSGLTLYAQWEMDTGTNPGGPGTNPTDPTPGGPGTPSHSHSHIDVWYIAGNSFGTSKSAVPTAVEIDGQPVGFTGDGREFTVSCIPAGARWVTVRWNSTSVTTNFIPDANAYCTEIAIPKTGDASVICYALMAVIAAAGAMGKK